MKIYPLGFFNSRFEELTYQQYFMSHVTENLDLPRGVKILTKRELLATDEEGNYVRDDVRYAWRGWVEGVNFMREHHKIQGGPWEGYDDDDR